MAKKKVIKNSKILVSLLIIVATIGLLIGKGYTAEDNHYCVTVQKNEATNKDDNLQVTERIVKSAGQQFYDSKTLDYEVELKNTSESKSTYYNRVAIDIDTSYSMETNDPTGRAKELAKELSQKLIQNSTNINISVVTNNAIKANLTNITQSVNAAIDGLAMGESQVGEKGLDFAYSSLSGNPENSNETANVNKYIIVFTDSTDDVEQKMKYLTGHDSDLKIITVLLNATSTSYIKNAKPVVGDVYYIDTDNEANESETTQTTEEPSTTIENNSLENNVVEDQTSVVPDGTEKYDADKIVNGISETIQDITVSDVFDDTILQAFTISDFSTTDRSGIQRNSNEITSEVKQNKDGYVWKVNKLRANDKIILKFKITLKTEQKLDVGLIFKDVSTNKEQNITYSKLDKRKNSAKQFTLNGVDGRENTDQNTVKESTQIRICWGYELKIKAVNESNTDVPVKGVKVQVVGKEVKETADDGTIIYGDVLCNITKTTDEEGYITITQEEVAAMRDSLTIEYTVTPSVSQVGYESTDSIMFNVISDPSQRTLEVDNLGSTLVSSVEPKTRVVSVNLPINSTKADFEIRTEELNNSNVTIAGAEYELIQPELNNHYKMNALRGTADENGILHFSPTVMTEDGTYTYILRQLSIPETYKQTPITLISVNYQNARITTDPTVQFNGDIKAKTLTDKNNHVLITVGNESLKKNPFTFQLSLTDEDDGSKISGVRYLIQTVDSNNLPVKREETTDSDGKINCQLYGTGLLTIKVTEQSPAIGYEADTTTKEVTINRQDGHIKILYENANKGKFDTPDTEKTILSFDTTSKKKTEQNVVRVKLVEASEIDVPVGRNVAYTLIDTETGYEDTKYSDREGEIAFTIDTKEQGDHRYTLRADETTVPEEYDVSKIEHEISFNLTFDSHGYISAENVINKNTIVGDPGEYYARVMKDTSVEYTCFLKIGYELNTNNIIPFKVQLTDRDNDGIKIQGAKYDINIEYTNESDSSTKTKTVKGRETNSDGQITTYITKAKNVRIDVKEVSAAKNYVMDTTTQEINLTFKNNGEIAIQQTPYDKGKTYTMDPLLGAAVEVSEDGEQSIVYQHANKKRSTADTYLNLTLNFEDKASGGQVKKYYAFASGTSDENPLQNKNNSEFKFENDVIQTGSQGPSSDSQIIFDYKDYAANPKSDATHMIKVPGIDAQQENDKVYYLYIEEAEKNTDSDAEQTFKLKSDTLIKVRFTFRQKDGRVKLTNVETTYGNRFIKNKTFSSSSDSIEGTEDEDNLGVYLGNVTLDIYSNYDDVGNLSLDLKKQSNTEELLKGAEYDVNVINTDGSEIKKHVEIKNGDNSADIELSGLTVKKDSKIYITETKAPIGHEINDKTETLNVKNIDDSGEIELEQIDQPYAENRLIMRQLASTPISAQMTKSNYEITLIDYQINTFNFGIKALDKADETKPASGYKFRVETSTGAANSVVTESDGIGTNKIGGSGTSQVITYTVSTEKAAQFYRAFPQIKVNVVFDETGYVNTEATRNAQTDSNFKKLWDIDELSSDEDGKIQIKVLVEHQGTLNVQIQTLDKLTKTRVAGAEYAITPSEELPGTGTTSIDVGYMLEDDTKTYTLEQTNFTDTKHTPIKKREIQVVYKNGNVSSTSMNCDATDGIAVKTGNSQITITVYVEPKVPFEIMNTDYFDKTRKLSGADFEIVEVANTDNNDTQTTDANGITGLYVGILGTDESKIYQVTQKTEAIGHKKIDSFYVKVTYNADREITEVKVVDNEGIDVTNNKYVEVSTAKTSSYSSYNGNNKGIVKINVYNQPTVPFEVTNLYYFDHNIKLQGANFEVVSKKTQDKGIGTTGSQGKAGIYCGIFGLDEKITYKVSQTKSATEYSAIEDFYVTVTYDTDGNVSNAEVTDEFGDTINNKFVTAGYIKTSTFSQYNSNQKGIVTLEVLNYPEFKINITNKNRGNASELLEGTQYSVTSQYIASDNSRIEFNSDDDISTDANGVGTAHLNNTKEDMIVTYTIHEKEPASGFQILGTDVKVDVSFDENGYVSKAVLEDNDNVKYFATASKIDPVNDPKENFIVNVELKNKPHFKLNIVNLDRRDGTTQIVGTTYAVSPNSKDESIVTDSTGLAVNRTNYTKDNSTTTYTITETNPATGYQSLGADIKINVTFNLSEGYVTNAELADSKYNAIASVEKMKTITKAEDNYTVNVILKNNPLLKIKLNVCDKGDHTHKLDKVEFAITGKQNSQAYTYASATNIVNKGDASATIISDENGEASAWLDKTIDSNEITYSIEETKKDPGYQWTDQEIALKVSYDANGAISDVKSAITTDYMKVTNFNTQDFTIDVDIYNEEIPDFGIHLSAVDTYDPDKKIDGIKVNAFLTQVGTQYASYETDGKYQLMNTVNDKNGNSTELVTGKDRNGTGSPTVAHGEDYESMGQYTQDPVLVGGEEVTPPLTRTLRLVVLNDVQGSQSSNASYYLDSSDGSKSGNNIGYYKGSKYYGDAKYQSVAYQYLITVTFDDEGRITDAKLNTGRNQNIGWLSDNRYIQTESDGVSISHTNYRLNITMKFFPIFELKLSAMNNWTFQDEVNKNGMPTALSGAKYTVSTSRHDISYSYETAKDEYVTAGYIGEGHGYRWVAGQDKDGHDIIYENWTYGERYESNSGDLLVPIDKNYTRLFYVFEDAEPDNYQEYTDKYITQYSQRMVAIIQVAFDNFGEVDYDNSILRTIDGNGTKLQPYNLNSGDSYLSSNNIKEYNYWYNKKEVNRDINFYIGYGITTTITFTAVDDISEKPIYGIKVYPYTNNTYWTNTSYVYREDLGYKTTNGNGATPRVKYWGAAEQNSKNSYYIGTTRVGNSYNGYIFPSDMTSTDLGGSGYAQDYYVKLDVTYGNDGKIQDVKSIGKDLWGDDNAEVTKVDKESGRIEVKIKFSRALKVQFNKVDYGDKTIDNLSAIFNVTSDKGLSTKNIYANTEVTLGKVYSAKTVKYTLSEIREPYGYYRIPETIDFRVIFDKSGNIAQDNVISKSDYFEKISLADTTERVNKLKSPDIKINIKDKQALIFSTRVVDRFYKTEGLAGVKFEITSDKGDQVTGNLKTDERGYAEITAGPVYQSDTVTYTLKQTNTIDGYYANTTEIKIKVEYDAKGTINKFEVLNSKDSNGLDVLDEINASDYLHTRNVDLKILNMPKNVKLGLYKYDQTTSEAMKGVQFTVTKVDINGGKSTSTTMTTQDDGNIIATIDNFTLGEKTIKYTLHEEKTPDTYRTMEDLVFIVKYGAEGNILSCEKTTNDNGLQNETVNFVAATDGKIQTLSDKKVHFVAKVPNDNSYDITVKDEDKDFKVGIEGTQYDVSINGEAHDIEKTNSNGFATIANLTDSGNIEVRVAERTVGEGCREDPSNVVTVKLIKAAQGSYSLKLDPTTDGHKDDYNAETQKAKIEVDEIHGRIYVTFKNEAKLELTLTKQDVNSGEGLGKAEFKITKQEIDGAGSALSDEEEITTDNNKLTDLDGKLYFDLGKPKGSSIWKYTFEEVEAPAGGYKKLGTKTMTVKFDQYGRISNQTSDDDKCLKVGKATSWYNCRYMALVVPNDNSFDLIIRDLDSEYPGELGIEETRYTVNINGEDKTVEKTSEKGTTTLSNVVTKGKDIEINIAESSIGEGYRADIANTANIKLTKGVSTYSLQLKNTTNGYVDENNAKTEKATIVVEEPQSDSEHGTIIVTFKNERKLDLTLAKYDGDTGDTLKDAEFTIVVQQIDNKGNKIGDEKTITTSNNNTTNEDGEIHFDLGTSPRSQIWRLTITETKPPEGYNTISTLSTKIEFDQYGRYVEKDDSDPDTPETKRLKIKQQHSKVNCRDIYVIVYNYTGDNDIDEGAYTVKVVTEDANSGKRISGAGIYLNITDAKTGEQVQITPKGKQNENSKPSASATNGSTTETGNLAVDGKMYTDDEVDDPESKVPLLLERGLMYIDNIHFEGQINIEVSEKTRPKGYNKFGQHTDGNVKANITYEDKDYKRVVSNIDIKDNDGFEVRTDNKNRIITIVIKNDSSTMFNIATYEFNEEPKDDETQYTEKGIQGVNYEITAEIVYAKENEKTDIDAVTPMSDPEGKTEVGAGQAYAGKTVVYTIRQTTCPSEYQGQEDIQVEVKYDTRGNIKYTEMLSSDTYTVIDENNTDKKEIYLNVYNKKRKIIPEGYRIILEKHTLDTDEDKNAYERLLTGAKYKITVVQENSGTYKTEWQDTTNNDGLIIRQNVFRGIGYIDITIEELEAPAGYKKDQIRTIRLYKDEKTGRIEEINAEDLNYEIVYKEKDDADSDNTDKHKKMFDDNVPEIWLKPVDKQLEGKFTLTVNKISAETSKYITTSPAKFSAVLRKEDSDGNTTFEYPIGEFYTNALGKAVKDNLEIPALSEDVEEGNYKLEITEEEAPEEYAKLKEPVILNVKIGKDAEGYSIIKEATVDDKYKDKVSFTRVSSQLIGVNIKNEIEVKEDEYSLNITKVARKTGEPIDSMAIFKVQLPDAKDTAVYTETKETQLGKGKLDYCYIEQDKDYTVRLTHMAIPKEEGTYEYVFKEVTPPEGYRKIDEDLKLDITFMKQSTVNKMKEQEKNDGNNIINDITSETLNNTTDNTSNSDEEDKMVITKVESSNENYMKWYYNGEDGQSFDITKPIKIDILDDIDKDEYTIHYDDNVADEEITVPEDQTKVEDTDINLSEDNPTREGYIFEGWALSPTATKADYKPRDTYKLNQPATLYAVWEEKLYLRSTKYLIDDGTNAKSKDNFWTEGQQSQYDDGDLYIKNIRPQAGSQINPKTRSNVGTTFEEFEENIKDNNADTIEFYIPDKDENGNIIVKQEKEITGDKKVGKTWQNKKWTTPMYDGNEETNLVATGMIVRLTKGDDQVIQLTLIVKGDIFPYCYKDSDGNENYTSYCIGNGKADLADNTKYGKILTRNLKKPTFFSEIEKQAIDYYMDADQGFSLNRDSLRYMYKKKNASITLLDN